MVHLKYQTEPEVEPEVTIAMSLGEYANNQVVN